MNYEEYIDIIEKLKNTNDIEAKDKLLNSEINQALQPMIEPKIVELIKIKYQSVVNKMISNLENMYSDSYGLDQYLVSFKKEILFIYELTNVKELSENKKNEMKELIKNESKRVYEILINKANQIDISGSMMLVIKNNEINWGD